MYPELLTVGPLTFHTYGLLVATGFLTGIWWMARLGEQEGISKDDMYDIAFWVVVAALVGSRIFFVIVNYPQYLEHPLDALKIWTGGLVFYGGLIGAVVAMVVMTRIKKLRLWKLADISAPALALGHSIGRLGCFFAGCCYGLKTDLPWAVTFTNVKTIAPMGVPLHPTQLYDSFNELSMFLILTALRPYKKFEGQLWWLWLGLYAIGRSVVEMYRGDPRGTVFDGTLTTSQAVAVVALTVAVIMHIWNWRALTARS
ncbi:MAG: prolipoprotein diacylglyceryl transferase [Nitrospinota bacterium]|nr:prolipoprotein diacylglyceryl transferase [Nitrospinota bacterium]